MPGIGTVVLNNQRFVAPSVPTYVDDISVPLDNSYPTGGYTGLETKLQGLTGDKRSIVDVLTAVDMGSGLFVSWDAANKKLKLFWGHTGQAADEVTAATDLHTITLRLRVLSE